jgi:hypothetical protein
MNHLAELYLGCDFGHPPDSATLFMSPGDERQMACG